MIFVGHSTEKPDELSEYLFDTRVNSEAVELNTWHHVVVTYTNNDRVYLYVNGRLKASKILSAAVRPLDLDDQEETYRWLVGFGKSVPSEDLEEVQSFAGSVDEISQYSRALSAEEVRILYEAAKGSRND